MRLVVRFNSENPSLAAIWSSRLLTADVVMPSSRAPALRLALDATAAKKLISDGWIVLLMKVDRQPLVETGSTLPFKDVPSAF